jgi:hypothetical protein
VYLYEIGAVRWKRLASGDPRSYRPNKGWEATAHFWDSHPMTGRTLRKAQWWIREEYVG